MKSVPPSRSGMASATMNALRQTGMTMGIALLGNSGAILHPVSNALQPCAFCKKKAIKKTLLYVAKPKVKEERLY